MLVVYTEPNTNELLNKHGPLARLPWLFVKGKVLAFVALVRAEGCYLAEADDQETADILQATVFRSAKNYELAAGEKTLLVLGREHAREALDEVGVHLGNDYANNRQAIHSFLDHLYRHNIFLVSGTGGMETLLKEKLSSTNVKFRVKGIAS